MKNTHHSLGSLRTLLERAEQTDAKAEVLQRLQWFLYFAEHESISATCKEFRIARSTFYRWFRRLNPHDLSTLENTPKSKLLHHTNAHSCLVCTLLSKATAFVRKPAFVVLMITLLINISLILLMVPQTARASTVVANTEAFEIIDDLDSDADISLQFGDSINKSLTYKRIAGTFSFDDDLEVQGFFTATGIDGAGLTDCDDSANQKLLWDATTKTFSCGTDQNTGGGGATTLQDAYANDADVGDAIINLSTDDDSLIIRNPLSGGTDSDYMFRIEQKADASGVLIESDATSAAALSIDASSTHILFGYNEIFDTDLFRDSESTLRTSGELRSDTLTVDGSTVTLSAFDCSSNANGGTLTVDATGQLVCSDDDSGADMAPYMVIDTIGDVNVSAVEATVNLDSEVISNANYSLSNDEITIASAGIYQISYTVSVDMTDATGSQRGQFTCHIQDDDTGAFTVTPGSYANAYIRENSGGTAASTTFMLELDNDNSTIRLRVDKTYGSTTINTKANHTSLSIIRVQ